MEYHAMRGLQIFFLVVAIGFFILPSAANSNGEEITLENMKTKSFEQCIQNMMAKDSWFEIFISDVNMTYCECMSGHMSGIIYQEYRAANSQGLSSRELNNRLNQITTRGAIERVAEGCSNELNRKFPKFSGKVRPEYLPADRQKVGLEGRIRSSFINMYMPECMSTADIAPKGRDWLMRSCQCIYGYVADSLSVGDLDLILSGAAGRGLNIFQLTLKGAVECRSTP